MKKRLLFFPLLLISICFVQAQYVVDFEDTTVGATSFMAGGELFNLSGDLIFSEFENFSCNGFDGKNKYMDTGYEDGGSTGVLGTIAPVNAGVTFRLSTAVTQCGWTGQEDGEMKSTGTIRFKGTKPDMSTVQEDFEFSSTNTSDMLPFAFSPQIWGGVELVGLEMEIVATQDATDYFAIDNLIFEKIGSATTFWSEDFETDGDGTRYVMDNVFIDDVSNPEGSEDYFGRIINDGSGLQYVGCVTVPIDVTNEYTGQSGDYFIAGEDMNDAVSDGCGMPNSDSAERNLQFLAANGHAINITGASDMTFRILVANGAENLCGEATSRWDMGEGLKVFYKKDGGAEMEALCFAPDLECNIPSDVNNEPLHWDSNCDGDGDGGFVNHVFSEYSFVIPAGGNSMELRIWINSDGSDEEIAYDNLRLEAVEHPLSFAALPSVCDGLSLTNLGNASPVGGTYSGPGVTDNGNGTFDFNTSAVGAGTYSVTYTVNGNSINSDITVWPLPVVSLTVAGLPVLNTNSGTQLGQGGMPSGGVYSGAGVMDDGNGTTFTFDPAVAGVGTHTINYRYTDGNGCENENSDVIEVFAPIGFTGLSNICIDAGVQTDLGGGMPQGGVYSGSGVTDNGNGQDFSFDPAIPGIGTHSVTYTLSGQTVSATLEVVALDDALFAYASTDYCIDGTDPLPIATSLISGFFSGDPTGLSVNSVSGLIDLSASTPGPYTLTYTTTGVCPNSASVGINIIELDDPSFAYSAMTYSTDELDPTPIITGVSGGTFTSMPAGLVVNNMNGTIDLSVSLPGVYTLTYTTSGICPSSLSTTLTINDVMAPTPGNECMDVNEIDTLFGGALNVPQISGSWDNTHYTSVNDPTDGLDCWVELSTTHTIWYAFIGDGSTYRIRSIDCTGNNYLSDTQAAIYSGDCTNLMPVACNEDENDADPSTYNILLDIDTEAGVNYFLMVDGHNSMVGEFCLEVTKLAPNDITNIAQTDIQIFPNPTNGLINLSNVDAEHVEVFDSMGRVVYAQEQPGSIIDLEDVSAGVYFVKLQAAGVLYSSKLVKK